MQVKIYYSFIMKVNFYICRHGQTDKNVEGVWQGSSVDVSLNETGHKQASDLARTLRFKVFDVYSSPLIRAVQTANAIVHEGTTERELVILQDLREVSFGVVEGLSIERTKEQYGRMVDDFLCPTEKTADLHFPNGESKREVFQRVKKCLEVIAFRHSGETAKHDVCVVCHAGVISALQFGLGLKNVSYENCAVLHLQYDTQSHLFVQI